MKHIIILILVLFALLSCSRDWNSPLENDSDLMHKPNITGIQLNTSGRMVLTLDYAYSGYATIQIERRISASSAFDPIECLKLSPSTFADTTLDMENNYDLAYRVKVSKGDYSTDYSNLVTYQYTSTILNAPSAFSVSTIELQGVRLSWQDNSNKETGYVVEKNLNGSAYVEIATLPANAETYMDNISGMPDSPLNLMYRIRAITANLNSSWQEQNVIYSGLGAPSNLHISNANFWEFTIAWTRNSTIATGYQIESKEDNGSYTLLATVGATTQTYNTQLLENGTYSFRIRAVRNSDYSSYSNEVAQQVSIVIPTDGLIAYYPFNGNADDESGNEYNGIPNNGPLLSDDRFGHSNKSYGFDGIDDYIQLNLQEVSLASGAQTTVSFWAKPTLFPTLSSLMPFGWCNGYYDVWFRYYPEFPSNYFFGFNTYNGETYGYNFVLSEYLNTWTHFVVTFTNNNVQNNQIYSNGQSHQLSLHHPLGTSYINSNAVVSNSPTISVQPGLPGNSPFSGSIDDVRIYSRALTEAEIQALYREGGWTGE